MPISDSKKVATMVNTMGLAATEIKAAVTEMNRIKTKYDAASPNTVGTPLDGKETAAFAALNGLEAQINTPIWDDLIADVSPSHRGEAL